ncbi:hypothetical protein BDZ91DRAFT_829012 [Kalaharituber pfeilii]|nr:hypothetical protein BDZ91DRAFT_829012 [Kalaharituber pfeilii]
MGTQHTIARVVNSVASAIFRHRLFTSFLVFLALNLLIGEAAVTGKGKGFWNAVNEAGYHIAGFGQASVCFLVWFHLNSGPRILEKVNGKVKNTPDPERTSGYVWPLTVLDITQLTETRTVPVLSVITEDMRSITWPYKCPASRKLNKQQEKQVTGHDTLIEVVPIRFLQSSTTSKAPWSTLPYAWELSTTQTQEAQMGVITAQFPSTTSKKAPNETTVVSDSGISTVISGTCPHNELLTAVRSPLSTPARIGNQTLLIRVEHYKGTSTKAPKAIRLDAQYGRRSPQQDLQSDSPQDIFLSESCTREGLIVDHYSSGIALASTKLDQKDNITPGQTIQEGGSIQDIAGPAKESTTQEPIDDDPTLHNCTKTAEAGDTRESQSLNRQDQEAAYLGENLDHQPSLPSSLLITASRLVVPFHQVEQVIDEAILDDRQTTELRTGTTLIETRPYTTTELATATDSATFTVTRGMVTEATTAIALRWPKPMLEPNSLVAADFKDSEVETGTVEESGAPTGSGADSGVFSGNFYGNFVGGVWHRVLLS